MLAAPRRCAVDGCDQIFLPARRISCYLFDTLPTGGVPGSPAGSLIPPARGRLPPGVVVDGLHKPSGASYRAAVVVLGRDPAVRSSV